MQSLWKKLTSWIDKKPSKVKFSTRLIAYVIDWFMAGIICGFPAVLIYGGVTGSSQMLSKLYDIPALGYSYNWAYLAAFLCFAAAIIYFVYIPYKKYPGQTLGKKWMHIKIVMVDGQAPDLKTLIIRQVIGLMFIESTAVVIMSYVRQAFTLVFENYMVDYMTAAIGSFFLIISTTLVYVTASRRSIHDYMAGTRVALEDEVYTIPVKKEKPRQKKKHK